MLQSPQALLDGITAAFYNAFFTALPIAAFAIWDRPVQNLDLLAEHPEAYNRKPKGELSARSFWKTGIFQGICHGAVSSHPRPPLITLSLLQNRRLK